MLDGPGSTGSAREALEPAIPTPPIRRSATRIHEIMQMNVSF